jgi:hypothetical protein
MSHTLLLALVAVLSGPAGGDASTQPLPPGLQERLQRIESAFRDGDASALRRSFATSGKLRVDLKNLTEGQEAYGASQLQVIFTQIFEGCRTSDFRFALDEVSVPSPGTAFARGRWTRTGRRERVELAETLTFTLRDDGSDWRILEIRSSR